MDAFIEGDRLYDILFGTLTGALCLAVAIPMLWWVLPKSRRWYFSRRIDPHQGLQLSYGIAVMAMAWTDVLCRYIPHDRLEWVHPAFFVTTLLMVLGLGPRVVYLARRRSRGGVLLEAAGG